LVQALVRVATSPETADALAIRHAGQPAVSGDVRQCGHRVGRSIALVAVLLMLAACADLGYYGQAAQGHLDVMARREPIDRLLVDAAVGEETRVRLALALEARRFASDALALPDNGSYRQYVDLGRPYVTYSLVAAPPLSIAPRQRCFPLAGCVPYRGYFSRVSAELEAARLRGAGDDVFTGPVRAYSTLGWFDDPLLSTMLELGETRMVGLIFHELAHQRVYVPGDSAFNESYAVAVEEEGVRRWLTARGDSSELADWESERDRETVLRNLLGALREDLERAYAEASPDEIKARRKADLLAQYRDRYRALKGEGGWDDSFDHWFGPQLNNALLALLGTYGDWVPAFQVLLRDHGGSLADFHDAVECLGALPLAERRERLQAMAASARPTADPRADRG
jgi:predicted aminopeptidase